MRIGLFTDAYFPIISGVSLSVDNLANELMKRGHNVFIITNHHEHATPQPHVLRLGGYKLPMKGMHEYRVSKVTRKKVMEVLALNLDIIHCHTEFTMGRLGRRAARKAGIPVVHTYHTMYEDYVHFISKTLAYPLRIVSKYYSRSFANSADHVIFPTIKVKRTFDRYGFTKRGEIIPTGITLQEFLETPVDNSLRSRLGFSKDDIVLLFLGRMSREKSIDVLAREFVKIQDDRVKLLMVGDGPDRAHVEHILEKSGVSNRVVFTGMVRPHEVHQYYKIADVFVNFSVTETQGLTYIESLASKTPLLVRYDDNLEGVVLPGINGFTFQTNDEFQSYIQKIITDQEVFDTITANADQDIQRFSAATYAQKVEAIYKLYYKG
ncbi:glycosyltransferase [Candidatus Xianfuyuplasma coldseepsis]|uniref:Glycosyltransferase family 4 protein n=1 Tax=Candidatus Xianfuyuplasma coldseepsis TaxID=2782163 RepID=A0A7L7KPY0_9MOLU|nr:glycosyltransferase [Xianfuyuplasma coldseepsis]QMS84773.1 glycosyltransferase family 4 protein [Xianfuyuplasma coldseepsis]